MHQQSYFRYLGIMLLVTLLTVPTFAQLRKIPFDVTDAFMSRYPHAEKLEWRDKLTAFEAHFYLNGFEMTADFSARGDWQKTEKFLNLNTLHNEVADGFKKCKYAGWAIISIAEISIISEPVVYRMLVKKTSLQKKYLYFNARGKLLRETITL